MVPEQNDHRVAMFVFNGDPMCFIHVLLNALDIHGRGAEAQIIVEGAATRLIPELEKEENPLNPLWHRVKQLNLVAGACKACSQKMGTAGDAQSQGLALLADMNGHPAMAAYRERGFEIITF